MAETNGQSADTRVQELVIRAKTQRPPWDAERLQALPKEKYFHLKKFISKRNRTHHGMVAFGDIDRFISSVGDIEMDWRSLLRICHKNKLVEPHLWSADYWTDSSRKEGLSFATLDGHLLISQGLYKTALARYILHYAGADSLFGVKVSQWTVDWEMYGVWLELKEICAERFPYYVLRPENKKISGQREGQSTIDEYLITLSRKDKRSGEISKLGSAGAKDWLDDLRADEEEPRFKPDELKVLALAA